MDIEKVIKFEWCDFEVQVPAITKKNKDAGYYVNSPYDKDLFWSLAQHTVVTRYKNYLVCNKFVIDIKKEEFIFFPRSYNNLHAHTFDIIIKCFNNKYNATDFAYGKFNRFERLYYRLDVVRAYPKDKLKQNLQDTLLQYGVIKEDLLIQAIQKVIDEANKEKSSQDNCTTLQEVSMEIF